MVTGVQAKLDVKTLTEKLQKRDLEAQPGRTMVESFENEVNTVLNKARDDAGTSAQNSLRDTNNVVRMVTAGSKGSFINISQVSCVRSVYTSLVLQSMVCFWPCRTSRMCAWSRPAPRAASCTSLR